MAPSAPDFFRKRTTSITSLSSSKLRSSVASLATRASRDRLTSDDRSSPITSGAATSSPGFNNVSTVDLFGGAPLQTTTSPIGAASDLDPDFGSSYEGPAAFHLGSTSAVSRESPKMNSPYHTTNAQEGAWLGSSAADHATLSPHVLGSTHFGTSPGNQSDMSNEAQFHNNDALSDVSATGRSTLLSIFASPGHTFADSFPSSSSPSSRLPPPGYENPSANQLYSDAINMPDLDRIDSRTANQYEASSALATPTLAEHATYEDARGYVGTNAASSTEVASNARHSTQSASTVPGLATSSSFAETSMPASNTAASMSTNNNGPTMEDIVPTNFDEGVLRSLCDMDCGMPLLFDRIKQSMVSAREASTFLKKRAVIEEEYARGMAKLARSTFETYSLSDAKAGTFVKSWHSMVKTHETLADNRLRFAAKLSEMSDELSNLAKEVDKSRKQARETGMRLEKNLQDAEAGVEKARGRFDTAAEDLERLLLLKSGESAKSGEIQSGTGGGGSSGKRTLGKAIGKSGLLFKNKNPQQILKQEEEIRARTSSASDAFRREVLSTQGVRQEYFNLQLPRILRTLKENAEEIDNGTQYHLARYAFLFESTVLNDGMAISPVGTDVAPSSGLKGAVETIDNRADFKQYMTNYQVAHGRDYKGPRREGPYEEGFLNTPGTSKANAAAATARTSVVSERPIFGVDLAEQMARDNVEVPPILEKCTLAIEEIGIENMGIYRLSGTTSKVQKLKAKFDADWTTVDLMNDEAIQDINIVAGCLKLWFRELPEPLLTHELYSGFIEAAKIDNDRLRHIRLHERVNELPDANYATLKYLMGHLDKVKSLEHLNQMSASNLAIVFGPTLLSPPPSGYDDGSGQANGGGGIQIHDMSFQCRAVETILDKYREIFVDEGEE
ncbi:related to GTPase-activating protein beta-chimerin [Ustilago trichophora]|uniref:Related to GTPase-activating protein beta-chimerin n=1 Tax=Ustilago trichophora TaxID=86804 RepID=A0A5C3ELT5_9BASI|nr:related to GTPase-activating protein beta-chimerin [Ustilago trichophora]